MKVPQERYQQPKSVKYFFQIILSLMNLKLRTFLSLRNHRVQKQKKIMRQIAYSEPESPNAILLVFIVFFGYDNKEMTEHVASEIDFC